MNAVANEVLPPAAAAAIPQGGPLTTSTNPQALIALALEKGAAIETLERLFALQKEWEANEARKSFHSAMAQFGAIPDLVIMKNKLVEFETRDGDEVSYHHAELSDVTDCVRPALGRCGLTYGWDITQETGQVVVTCTLTHRDGHSKSVTMRAAPDTSGKKNAIQQAASAVTYLQRYTLLAITGMSTKGQDDDGGGFTADGKPFNGGDGDGPDPNAEWRDCLEACTTLDELAKRKVELIDSCGGDPNSVPKPLSDLCVAMARKLAPKAGAR